MKLGVTVVAVAFAVFYCIDNATCVPIAAKDDCELDELKSIPKCESDDKKCLESNSNKRKKRQTLCERNPDCSFCGELIPGDVPEDIVAPQIVQPILVDNGKNETEKKLIERNIIIENDNETQYYRGYVESAANITTVIRLTNLINNTNIINMPTTLNNTNINNIHIYQNKTSNDGGKFGLGYNEKGSCCYSVEPRSCKQSTAGLKCRHKKSRVCGHQCSKKFIHPTKNACRHVPQWPYVTCPQSQPNYFQGGYNPGYYQPNPYYPPYNPQAPPSFDDDDDDDDDGPLFPDDDDDGPLFPDDDELKNPDKGWVPGPEKCKIVSEDGLRIENCTNSGAEFEHPFAKNSLDGRIKRNVRYTNNYPQAQMPYYNQMMPQPQMIYPMYPPMMFQPNYYQPMPVYAPQYYPQPPPPMMNYYQPQPMMNYYQPQQIPMPPIAEQNYYGDIETNEVDTIRKPKRHTRQRHHVVIDADDEL